MTVAPDQLYQFIVEVSPESGSTYQWQVKESASSEWRNFTEKKTALTYRLWFTVTEKMHGWQFRCIIKNGSDQVISTPFTVWITGKEKPTVTPTPAPVITPADEQELTGWQTINGYRYYYSTAGVRAKGWQTISGKKYYFDPSTGVMKTGWIKVDGREYYMDKSTGVMVTKKGTYDGRKGQFNPDGALVYNTQAADVLDQVGWDLKKAYDWDVDTLYYVGYTVDNTKPISYYADYGFKNHKGNCYVYASVFYMLAKELGYDVHQVYGGIQRADGSLGRHSWIEITIDGKTAVYDPEFESVWYSKVKTSTYAFQYGKAKTWKYTKQGELHE